VQRSIRSGPVREGRGCSPRVNRAARSTPVAGHRGGREVLNQESDGSQNGREWPPDSVRRLN
jgi:hypothetical protein